jgi:hypothetical protein
MGSLRRPLPGALPPSASTGAAAGFAVELVLWACLLVPRLIYTLWQLTRVLYSVWRLTKLVDEGTARRVPREVETAAGHSQVEAPLARIRPGGREGLGRGLLPAECGALVGAQVAR